MAQPLQYQSQFIPTDFNTTGNLLGMFRQDMAQRNQEFDATASASNEALAGIAALPTADIEGRNQMLANLEKRMEEAVQKRGGDYRLAAKDLQRIVAQERANPWYQLNAEQQEAIKNYKQLTMDADNLVIGNPYKPISQAQQELAQGINPFQVTALKKSDLYTRAADVASNYADLLLTDPQFGLSSQLGGQYWERVAQRGFDDESINTFIESGEGSKIMKSMLASYPQLEGLNEQQAREIIKQGLRKAIGKTEATQLANRNYVSDADRMRSRDLESNVPRFSEYPSLSIEDKQNKIEKDFSLLRKGLNKKGEFDPEQLDKNPNIVEQFGQASANHITELVNDIGKLSHSLIKDIHENLLNKEYPEWNDYETVKIGKGERVKKQFNTVKKLYEKKYSDLYNQVKSKNGYEYQGKIYKNDEDFLNLVEDIEIKNTALIGTELGVNDQNISKDIFNKVIETADGRKSSTFINAETGKGISRTEAEERLGSSQVQMRVDGHGNIKIQIPDKKGKKYEDYIINPEALPANVTRGSKDINEIRNVINKFNFTDEEIQDINNSFYMINGTPYKIEVDKNDPLNKNLFKIVGKDPYTNEFITQPASLSELQFMNTVSTYSNINVENK